MSTPSPESPRPEHSPAYDTPATTAPSGEVPAVPVTPSMSGQGTNSFPEPFAVKPRSGLLLVSGFATLLLASVATLIPVPFALLKPGPTINTLGTVDGVQLIDIPERKTYPATGNLNLTTVSVFGGPGHRINLLQAFQGWLDDTVSVEPKDDLFPPGQTEQESKDQTEQEMISSQESATAAALDALKVDVPTTLTVTGIGEGVPAMRSLRTGDVLLKIGESKIKGLAGLRARLEKVKAGDDVRMTVRRNGKDQVLAVTTMASPSDGHTILGVYLDPEFIFPFQVKIQIEDIGGPSAGLMFALGIIDKLTPGSLTGGKRIAGTGTMDADGTVGPIGGIQQKLVGARRTGADWFLAPADNCPEVVGHIPEGLRVVKVSTLDEATQALGKIASGKTLESLPACTAD